MNPDDSTRPVFLAGEWRKLLMVNYVVAPALLLPMVPKGTRLNFYLGKCFVTLAGFVFNKVTIGGIPVPLHREIPEVNLRFYAIPDGAPKEERGVVFIREIVAKPLIAFAANRIYHEKYRVLPVKYAWELSREREVSYAWKEFRSDRWNSISVRAAAECYPAVAGSEEDFITRQLRGYTTGPHGSYRYVVEHPPWDIYPVDRYRMAVDFAGSFGAAFGFLKDQTPASVYLAEGSPVAIRLLSRMC